MADCGDAGCTPKSQNPVPANTFTRVGISQLLQQAIVDIQQMWWVGDSTAGGWLGQLANQCKQALFQDHAEDINYW